MFLIYVVVAVGFGLMLYHTASHRNLLGIVAFVFAYLGGLILILGAEPDTHTHLPVGLIPSLVAYGVAVILIVVYVFHAVAAHQTLANGVRQPQRSPPPASTAWSTTCSTGSSL